MADQAKGKGIAPKRASNPADPGQSSRPPPPIQTLSEDEEDGEDYSEVIEVLKQHIKSHKRVIASQSSDIKTLLLSLNTLKASIKDSISAIKNISSTLASLTNSSNAAATGKTSYSPRFDPFSGTMDLDSPPRPPRKEPHLGPAINSATSNLDPPIDTGSKEGFKDTITSSIVKELSKKAYTIPDDSKLSGESNFKQWIQALSIVLRALGISNFLENPDISNTYSDSDQAVLLMLLRDSLSSGPRAAISWIYIPSKAFKLLVRQYSRPIESKKEDVYNEFHALTFSTYRKGLSAFNAEFNGYLAKLTIAKIDIDPSLILNQYFKALESKFPSWAYRAAHIANSSNSTPNSNSNPSKKGKNKKKGSYNLAVEEEEEESDSSSNSSSSSDSNTQLAQLLALKGYKKRKDFKGKGLKTSSNNKAKYKDNKPRRRPRDPALYNSWLYDTGSTDYISNSKERKAPPTYTKLVLDNVLYLPNIDINIVSGVRYYNSGGCLIKETLYGGDRRCIAVLDFKKSGFFLDVKGSSKPILHRNKIVVEIPSNSIRKEDYRPIIEDAIVSEAIEPNKRYKLRNSPAKGTTLEGIGPSLRGKRPCRPTREPEPLTGTGDLPCVLREPVIEGNKVVEKAISSPTLKEPNIGQRDYYNLLNLAKLWHVRLGHIGLRLLKKTSSITKGLSNFDKIKEADFHCSSCDQAVKGLIVYNQVIEEGLLEEAKKQYPIVRQPRRPIRRGAIGLRRAVLKTSTVKFIEDNTVLSQPTDNTALEGELVDLDLDLEGAVSPDPSNLNTEKPISIEIGPSKLEPYESSSDKPIFAPKPIEVIAPNQPITNEPLNNSDLISEGDKMQLDYYKLLAKTSSYILSFVYKARKRVISKDSTPTTYKQVLKLPRDERSKWLEAITKEFIQLLELGVFKFLPRSLLPSNYKLITCRNVLKVEKDAKNRPIKYKSRLVARGFIQVEGLDYTVTYASTRVFYNAKTCHFIVTYIDDCLFIGPNIGYITDLKKRLNKVYTIEDLGPAAYFLGLSRSLNRPTKSHLNAAKNLFKYLNSTKDYSICFSCNGNTVADLGPKLSNSSNTTTKLSRDFHSKEGPRPLTTTSTTIVDSRNSKGSSRTSIINSSLVPIGFSDSDFTGDKATSKSTYGYLYKLAGLFSELHRPIDYPITLYGDNQGSITVANDPALYARTKHTLLKFRYVREQVKAKIVTIIYLNTKYMPADGLTKALPKSNNNISKNVSKRAITDNSN
ncbi:hypothetical protein P8C59_000859 [Phyllachora maydis]|uniref:Reverse transcriptase Ty1/copia-type domain-containing protein n=1 Tax=Phyllachora maydis TaxID=1825666 RepID=A0AAD9M9F0_9PEZI|nr:hypothetical protein P8C59_000859 [Phyllachora maydis]